MKYFLILLAVSMLVLTTGCSATPTNSPAAMNNSTNATRYYEIPRPQN